MSNFWSMVDNIPDFCLLIIMVILILLIIFLKLSKNTKAKGSTQIVNDIFFIVTAIPLFFFGFVSSYRMVTVDIFPLALKK